MAGILKALVTIILDYTVRIIMDWWQARQAKIKKDKEAEDAIKKYNEAKTPEEQENAFKDLVNSTRPKP